MTRVNSDASDTVLRAMTDDGAFRVIAVDTTRTVRGAVAAQKATGAVARTFADLLTGAVLVRESMAPDLRLQAILQGDDGRSRMVADALPDGSTRGLLQLATGAVAMPIAKSGLLQVARTMHNGALQQGVVAVPGGATGLSAAYMAYMQESEQVVTMMAVGCHVVGDEILAAGGYLVQLLPEVEEGPLMVMTERLKDFLDIDPLLARGDATPEKLLAETLYGMPYTRVAEREVRFGCHCSSMRVTASFASLPRADIEALLADPKVLEITCDYCGKEYKVAPEQLRGLIMSS